MRNTAVGVCGETLASDLLLGGPRPRCEPELSWVERAGLGVGRPCCLPQLPCVALPASPFVTAPSPHSGTGAKVSHLGDTTLYPHEAF